MIEIDDITWQPRTAPEALRSLEILGTRLLEHDDQRAVFVDVYTIITRKVVNLMETRGHAGFLDPQWLSELTGLFAEEALIAIRCSLLGEPVASTSWRIATDSAADRLTAPYESAILGINAHINYDLGMVVYQYLETHRERIDDEQLRRYHHDYMRVNKILEQSVLECVDVLIERYDCLVSRSVQQLPLGRPLSAHAVMVTLESWRNHVWTDVVALWNAPDDDARAGHLGRMDRRAGRIAQLVVSGPALRRWLLGRRPLGTVAG